MATSPTPTPGPASGPARTSDQVYRPVHSSESSPPRLFFNKSLDEIERILYITDDPLYGPFSLRSLSMNRKAYEDNMKTMTDFVKQTCEDLCLAPEVASEVLPKLAEVYDEGQPDLFS